MYVTSAFSFVVIVNLSVLMSYVTVGNNGYSGKRYSMILVYISLTCSVDSR